MSKSTAAMAERGEELARNTTIGSVNLDEHRRNLQRRAAEREAKKDVLEACLDPAVARASKWRSPTTISASKRAARSGIRPQNREGTRTKNRAVKNARASSHKPRPMHSRNSMIYAAHPYRSAKRSQ